MLLSYFAARPSVNFKSAGAAKVAYVNETHRRAPQPRRALNVRSHSRARSREIHREKYRHRTTGFRHTDRCIKSRLRRPGYMRRKIQMALRDSVMPANNFERDR